MGLGALAAAALLAVLWPQRDGGPGSSGTAGPADAGVVPAVGARAGVTVTSVPPGAGIDVAAPPPVPGPSHADADAALRSKMADETHSRLGGALVDEIVARGLARSDAERVVRRFVVDSVDCLLRALRSEADAQSVAYDSILDALEAELYDADGPLLTAVIDMQAVQTRAAPCGLTAAEQAGISPAVMVEAARALQR